jgi:hypothetical protein
MDHKETIFHHTFYPDGENNFIPGIELVKVSGNFIDKSVWFLWQGTEQFAFMSKDNEYGDFHWLIKDTEYTDKFQEFLDDELGGYDSLETMFSSLDKRIPENYELTFERG